MFGASARAAAIFTIDFETEDDFTTPLIHGQSVYSTARLNNTNPSVPFSSDSHLEFGRLISVSSTQSASDGHLGPAIFNSDPGGAPGGELDLQVGLGNVLILQRDESPNTSLHPNRGLVFNNPNDEATPDDNGSIVIDFLTPVHPISIDLVDVDIRVNMNVLLTDRFGLTRTYAVPSSWTTDVRTALNGYQTLNLEMLTNQPAETNAIGGDAIATQNPGFNDRAVVRLEVEIFGQRTSGGIDNVVFLIPEPGTMLLGVLGALVICSRLRTMART
jgi:hypothetical protein